jgi:hypothetical protein
MHFPQTSVPSTFDSAGCGPNYFFKKHSKESKASLLFTFGEDFHFASPLPTLYYGLSSLFSSGTRTHLMNISGSFSCETGVAQGVSADLYGGPLGTDR